MLQGILEGDDKMLDSLVFKWAEQFERMHDGPEVTEDMRERRGYLDEFNADYRVLMDKIKKPLEGHLINHVRASTSAEPAQIVNAVRRAFDDYRENAQETYLSLRREEKDHKEAFEEATKPWLFVLQYLVQGQLAATIRTEVAKHLPSSEEGYQQRIQGEGPVPLST